MSYRHLQHTLELVQFPGRSVAPSNPGIALDGSEKSVTHTRLLVSVVDDDESIRESLPALLQELGFAARTFSSAEDFLLSDTVSEARCLILDIAMSGMTGLELQHELQRRQILTPIIFITAHQDEAVRRETIAKGAVGCLLKPFTDTALLDELSKSLPVK